MTIGTSQKSICLSCSIRIMRIIRRCVIPMRTFRHCRCLSLNLRCRSRSRIDEVSLSITCGYCGCARSCIFSFTATYLSTLNLHKGIAFYTSVLTATIDGAQDKGSATDGYISLFDVCMEVCVGIIIAFHCTSTGSEYKAVVNRLVVIARFYEVSACIFHTAVFQHHFHRTNLSTIHQNGTLTSTIRPYVRLSTHTSCMRSVIRNA